jgi:hypothetical protein
MSFVTYRADSFTEMLNNKVDDLNYKRVLTSQRIDVVQQVLQDSGITIPSGGVQ